VRLAVGIEYAGTRYAGWQRQDHAPSVQAEVERALGSVADHPIHAVCAGRTDAGVHALGQVAHFDTTARRPLRGWLLGANAELPSDVALTWVTEVAPDFHARYAALTRTYRYLVLNRPTRAPLAHARACQWRTPLDAGRMHAALQALVGEHDFSTFRAAECQAKGPVRRLDRISARREGQLVVVEVAANAFLHHMVRNIVGSALQVGEGARPLDWLAALLAGRDRRAAGPTAPPGGLYLAAVEYPIAAAIPPAASHGVSAMIGPSAAPEGSG
jgi:tRNA pseudouridine38-40 synthase